MIVRPEDAELDEASAELAASDRAVGRNVDVIREWAQRAPEGKPRRVHLRFLSRPVELQGRRPRPHRRRRAHPADARGRRRGHRRVRGDRRRPRGALGRLSRARRSTRCPFDAGRNVIPHVDGRVERDGATVPGEYVAGWIKRGPTGIIGTNKKDAVATVASLLADAANGRLPEPRDSDGRGGRRPAGRARRRRRDHRGLAGDRRRRARAGRHARPRPHDHPRPCRAARGGPPLRPVECAVVAPFETAKRATTRHSTKVGRRYCQGATGVTARATQAAPATGSAPQDSARGRSRGTRSTSTRHARPSRCRTSVCATSTSTTPPEAGTARPSTTRRTSRSSTRVDPASGPDGPRGALAGVRGGRCARAGGRGGRGPPRDGAEGPPRRRCRVGRARHRSAG